MPRTSYYDDNKNRRYPFISTETTERFDAPQLPDGFLVDAGFHIGAAAQFNPSVHSVWLSDVSIVDDVLTCHCQTDAAGISDYQLEFSVSLSSEAEFQTIFADIFIPEEDNNCRTFPLWYGFLVFGNLSTMADWILSHGNNPAQIRHSFEPALIQNLARSQVLSVSLANQQRTKTTDSPGESRPYLVSARCLQGDLIFREGYNCRITYSESKNSLTISGAVGEGAGEPCSELPQVPGEVSPDGGSLLSGGPTCQSTIRAINGINGPDFKISGGKGVTVSPVDDHQLKISVSAAKITIPASGGI